MQIKHKILNTIKQILSLLSTSLQPDITSHVFSSPFWFQVGHPLMYLDTEKHYHTKINWSGDASIHWCSCNSILNCSETHNTSCSLLLRMWQFYIHQTKVGSLDRHWSHLYNVIGPECGVGWTITFRPQDLCDFSSMSLTVFSCVVILLRLYCIRTAFHSWGIFFLCVWPVRIKMYSIWTTSEPAVKEPSHWVPSHWCQINPLTLNDF
jgi:hypothetical protein